MSSRARTGIQPPTPSAREGIKSTIQKAHALVATTHPESLKQLWHELCQKYLDAVRIGLTHETFPYWIHHNIPEEAIQHIIDVVYGKGASKIGSYAPTLLDRFGVPEWQFVLFLGHLPQSKVVALNKATRARPNTTFDSLYHELCRIRSQKETLPDGPFDFKLSEIKSCFQDSDSGDDLEAVSDDDYQTSDETSCDTIYVGSSSEDDHGSNSEYGIEDEFDTISDSDVNHNASQESSSTATDGPDKHTSSPIHTTSSTSVANSATPSLNTQRSAPDDTLDLITQQLDHGQGRQASPSEVPRVASLLDGDRLSNTIVTSDRTVINTQEQTTCSNDTTNQYLVDLRNTTNLAVNTVNLLSNTIDSLWTLNEELERDQATILQEETETSEDTKAKHQLFEQLTNSDWTPEVEEAATATALGIVCLAKKRHLVGQKRQEHQAKRLKHDTDIKEFSIKEFMASQGLVLE